MEIVYIVIGLIFGIIITWLLVKNKFQKGVSKLTLDKNLAEDKINGINENLSNLKDELVNKENTIIDLSKQLASKSADYKNLNDKLQEQKADVEKLQERFKIEFKNLANEILEEKTQKFTELNKINISEILKPLNEKIKDFEKKVEETYDKESKQRFSLKEEVKRLAELNLQVSKDTINLTKALKGDSKAQGNWGEVVLGNILERSGLVRDREYFIQTSFYNDERKRLQPDVVIAYPGNRNVVVDSKVSLTAYERYASADSPEEKEVAAKEHILSIKNHINELSQKNYQDLYQLKSLDFVMMFLPVEPAYLIAIQKDSDLWNYAYDKRVLLISPTNLIAALKMVESLWKQEYQSKNVLEIAKQSGDLYDKFVGLAEDLTDIGNKLKATQKSYDSSMNKLLTGKGNLVGRVEKIKKLGAKTSKVLSQQFLNKLEDEN
ncbi:MAG: DNA recombination protein RmuC [Bacteroidales bacterium]|nr:DNA recombination protein RmuC [Bacteroidales bacterium]